MEWLANQFLDLFTHFGYWAVFFGVMLENAGIPVPGETILLFASFLAWQGRFELPAVILIACCGATLGDNIGFVVGRHGGRALLDRYTRGSKHLRKRLAQAEAFFHRHGAWAVFVARFVTGLRVFAGPLAGALRMSWPRFLFFNLSGAIVWSIAISLVGYFFGSQWELLLHILKRVNAAIFAVAALLVWLLWRRHNRSAGSPQSQEEHKEDEETSL
jgi:membrane protein DedA with SNARE-associated domain